MPESAISITVRLFASIKDVAKMSEISVELPRASVADDVLSYLITQYPEMQRYRSYVRIAVNESYVDANFALHDGDEIAIIPPVSGGC